MEYDPVSVEILRMAKELVTSEYTDKRAELHNKWLIESEHLWKTQRLRVAYPTIPPHPTEKYIVEVANVLMSFVVRHPVSTAEPNLPPKSELPVVEEVTESEPVPEWVPSMVPDLEPEPEKAVDVIEKPVKNALVMIDTPSIQIEESVSVPGETQSKVLPKVLQRLEEMKRNFF